MADDDAHLPEDDPERLAADPGAPAEDRAPMADPAADDSPAPSTALPPKLEAWRRRSAAGAILTGFALGLQEALEPKRDEPSIMIQTSGDPPKDLPVEAEFEYGRPRQSVVQIRPWLLEPGPASAGTSGGADGERAAQGERAADAQRAADPDDADPGRDA